MKLVYPQEELQAATYASLRAHATSEQAKALVAKLSAMVEDHTIQIGLRKNKRKDTAGKLAYATGAFLADLLLPFYTDEPNGWVYRSLKKASFNGASVPRRTFEQLMEGLKGLAFLDHVPGHKVSSEREDTGRYAARFRATPALLRFSTENGVDPGKASDHFEFEYDLPEHPIELRARKIKDYYNNTAPSGRTLTFERDFWVEAMEPSIQELNEFFAKQTLRGGMHHGYIRIFSNGDDPDFRWNKGGRFYSQHYPSYQVLSADERARMTINGEPVAEVDIRASYLTIFLSTHGIQLDAIKDPYELPGLNREHRAAVKAWMVATFGNTKRIRRWPPRMLQKSPELRQYRVSTITTAALAKYPALETWGEATFRGHVIGWADLMYLESAIMFSTMLDLMRDHHTPSLSVHDSLIVPVSRAEVARDAIKARFLAQQKVTPLLKINMPPETSKNAVRPPSYPRG
jgi:hypothetical protein